MNAVSTLSLYLCVDCGGTKTSAVICNPAGDIVGRALGGPSNFSYLGPQLFLDVLKSTVEKAFVPATSSSGPANVSNAHKFASVWIAVAGVDSPSDIRTLSAALSQLFSIPEGNRLRITNDAHLLASPLHVRRELKSAVAVIAGTGSVVITFARNNDTEENGSVTLKEMARAGGWGWMLGDEGGGFDVGREAVREILTQADRGSVNGPGDDREEVTDKVTLKSRVLSYFGITSVLEIFSVVYAPDPAPSSVPSILSSQGSEATSVSKGSEHVGLASQKVLSFTKEQRLSRLAPLVFRSAFEDKDELALTVLRRCARSLAGQIAMLLAPSSAHIAEKPNYVEAESAILCLGGTLVGIIEYRDLVLDELKDLGHVFAAVEFVGGGDIAAAGARGLAMADRS